MKPRTMVWVLLAAILAGPAWARQKAPGGVIEEVGDTAMPADAPAEVSAPQPAAGPEGVEAGEAAAIAPDTAAPAVVDTALPSAAPATFAEAQQQAEQLREQARALRSKAREAQTLADLLDMKVRDAEGVIRSNESRIAAAEAEIARHAGPAGDSGAVEDDYVSARRTRIEKHRSIIADMRVIADSLGRERATAIAGVRAIEDQAEDREHRAKGVLKAAEKLDKRPMNKRFPVSFGYQCHYTSVPPYDDGKVHLVRMAGFHFSWAIRPYLIAGARDVMLYFNETVEGDRMAVSLSPFVGAGFFPLRRLEIEGAIGAIFQGQTGGSGGNDGVVAPYVSVALDAWPFKHFSVGPIVRVNYLAVGNIYAGAIPSERSDVLPEGASWFDVGLSFSLHF